MKIRTKNGWQSWCNNRVTDTLINRFAPHVLANPQHVKLLSHAISSFSPEREHRSVSVPHESSAAATTPFSATAWDGNMDQAAGRPVRAPPPEPSAASFHRLTASHAQRDTSSSDETWPGSLASATDVVDSHLFGWIYFYVKFTLRQGRVNGLFIHIRVVIMVRDKWCQYLWDLSCNQTLTNEWVTSNFQRACFHALRAFLTHGLR